MFAFVSSSVSPWKSL